jgi:hypothetical protein
MVFQQLKILTIIYRGKPPILERPMEIGNKTPGPGAVKHFAA